MEKTVRILVSGKVQGVFYRQSTMEQARRLGVTGNVRNLPDGSVHITATGTNEQLAALVEWCGKGPERAKISRVIVEDAAYHPFDRFEVIR